MASAHPEHWGPDGGHNQGEKGKGKVADFVKGVSKGKPGKSKAKGDFGSMTKGDTSFEKGKCAKGDFYLEKGKGKQGDIEMDTSGFITEKGKGKKDTEKGKSTKGDFTVEKGKGKKGDAEKGKSTKGDFTVEKGKGKKGYMEKGKSNKGDIIEDLEKGNGGGDFDMGKTDFTAEKGKGKKGDFDMGKTDFTVEKGDTEKGKGKKGDFDMGKTDFTVEKGDTEKGKSTKGDFTVEKGKGKKGYMEKGKSTKGDFTVEKGKGKKGYMEKGKSTKGDIIEEKDNGEGDFDMGKTDFTAEKGKGKKGDFDMGKTDFTVEKGKGKKGYMEKGKSTKGDMEMWKGKKGDMGDSSLKGIGKKGDNMEKGKSTKDDITMEKGKGKKGKVNQEKATDNDDFKLPPTLSSGYGVMTEDDFSKSNLQILNDFDSTLKAWVEKANPYMMNDAIKIASKHEFFPKYLADLWDSLEDHKFGQFPKEDLIKFELWLKKHEISEKKAAITPSSKELSSPEEPKTEAYKEYWKKYERKNAGSNLSIQARSTSTSPGASSGSPSPSPATEATSAPDSETGITPECKRKLQLEGEDSDRSSRPPLMRRSTSVMSDGSGDVSMEPLGEHSEGRVKRVKMLTGEDAERIKAMTCFEDLAPEERKRQREALRRRLAQRGLRPGLIQKWQSCQTSKAKFEFLRAFMLDPQNMSSITIEAEYVDAAQHDENSQWKELPLVNIRQMFPGEAGQRFIQNEIISKQGGRQHPQDIDGSNPELRLYWVFTETSDVTRSRQSVATRVSARGEVPQNKAAMAAVADGVLARGADFASKGGGKGAETTPPIMGKGKKGKGNGKVGPPKAKKVKSAEEIRKKDFDDKLQKVGKLASKARAAAEAITSSGINHQEATIAHLKGIYSKLNKISKEISDDIFRSVSFDICEDNLSKHDPFIQDAAKQVQEAEGIKESHDRRVAAEKRKAEKAAAKASGKAKAKAKSKGKTHPMPEDENEVVQDEWPEDAPNNNDDDCDVPDLDGEPMDEDEDMPEMDDEEM